MTDDTLDILLIEDNPGDVRLIEEMLRSSEELVQRVDHDTATGEESEVHHESRLVDGLEVLADDGGRDVAVDAVLLDLNLPDSRGLDTLASVVDATEYVPIVVLTGLRDEQLGIEAIQSGAQDYLVKDEVTSDLLVRSIHHAVERNRQERAEARHREQLEAVNRLNRIGQDITHAVITSTSREELEQAVCERLVGSDAYRFAWIGDVNPARDRVTPRVWAGIEEGYLDEIEVTIDGGETAKGPGGTAIRTHEVQVVQHVQSDPGFEPWAEPATERGYRSIAAVPIVHGELLYGILGIYAGTPNTFSLPEAEILGRLGDVIGHAITAIERKQALMSDTVLELEFGATGIVEGLVARTTDPECRIDVEHLIHSNDAILAYGEVEGIDREAFVDAAQLDGMVDEVRVLTPDVERGAFEFEIVTTAVDELASAVATHGGRLDAATIENGQFRFVVEFPPGRDRRQLVELVEDHCDVASSFAQRTVNRSEQDVPNPRSVLEERLSERQRVALETAYHAGFFEWPRTSTGQEVADRLDISASTFTQHLRTAERKFFEEIFEGANRD